MNIDEFRDIKTWAVVGSVHNKEKYAYKIYNFLKNKGYTVLAVDPSGEMVDNDESYKSLADLPVLPDALDMVINPVKGKDYLNSANSLGIKNIWFQPGAESEELIQTAEGFGMNVIHNRCVMVEF